MTSKFTLSFGQQEPMTTLGDRMPRPRIGILPTGLKFYWDQFPNLKQMGERMFGELRRHLGTFGELIAPELVDTPEKATAAARFFNLNEIDILLIFPFGYTTGMCVAPVASSVTVPIRLLNAHEDSSYEYKTADTALYLHHEGVCCIPEYAGTLVELGKAFKVRTGHFKDSRFWGEVKADCVGAAAARAFKALNFGVIGKTYDNMTDMPFDEHRLLKTTGRLLNRPEVEEIENAFGRVSSEQLDDMSPTNCVRCTTLTRRSRMIIFDFQPGSRLLLMKLSEGTISARSDTTGGEKESL